MQWTNITRPEKYNLGSLGPMAPKNCRCLATRVLEDGTDARGLYSVCVKYLRQPRSGCLFNHKTTRTRTSIQICWICWIHRRPGLVHIDTSTAIRPRLTSYMYLYKVFL